MITVWESHGPASHWFIFASREDREAKISELAGTWEELEDRSTLLNYVVTWNDVQGFGLEVAHADWAGRTVVRQ